MEQTFNQEPNLPHSDKTKDIFNRWIREEGIIDFSGGQYLVSRQQGCKGENIYFGGEAEQNRTGQTRTKAKSGKKEKKSFIPLSNNLRWFVQNSSKCWYENTKRRVRRRHTSTLLEF